MSNQDYQLRTLSRALELLQVVERTPNPLTLTEIASLLNEPTPVIFRILKTLESHGYLTRGPNHKRYSLTRGSDGLSSVRQTISVLRALSKRFEGLSAEEISVSQGVPREAVTTLLSLLCEEAFVMERASGQWVLAPSLLEIVRPLLAGSLVSLVRPTMERLRDEVGETVALWVQAGTRQMLVDSVPSREAIRYVVDIGTTHALHRGAAGKAALAGMSDDQFLAFLQTPEIKREKVDEKYLSTEIGKARANGYAVSEGERVDGACSIATWIRDVSGESCAVISVLGPAFRQTPEVSEHIAKQLLDAVSHLVIPVYAVERARAGVLGSPNSPDGIAP